MVSFFNFLVIKNQREKTNSLNDLLVIVFKKRKSIKLWLLSAIFFCFTNASASTKTDICSSNIDGYRVIKNSVYPFSIDNKKACFFAFHITNPKPTFNLLGMRNLGDTLWYGYYLSDNPIKVYELPKPLNAYWYMVCELSTVSFKDMNDDGVRDITILGACGQQNIMGYSFALVFMRRGEHFVFDEDVFRNLYGFRNLTVNDIHNYIKSPNIYYEYLLENA